MDSTNPYSPPKAAVADVDDYIDDGETPREVNIAVILLWVTVGITTLTDVIRMIRGQFAPGVPFLTSAMIVCVSILPVVWLTYMIGTRRNWARITWIVLFTIGLVSVFFMPRTILSASVLIKVVYAVQMVLQSAVLVLLLTPNASRWFKRRNA